MAALRRIRNQDRLRFSKSDFARAGHYGLYQAAAKRFGSWKSALAAAGISHADHTRKRPNGWHADVGNVLAMLDELARKTGKPVYALQWRDFEANGASGLLQHYGSVEKVLLRAGIKIPMGGRRKNAAGYWDMAANRIRAVRAVVRRSGKGFVLKKSDFHAAGVPGLLRGGRTIYSLCREAGFKGEPWELERVPNNYFARADNRMRAVRWLEQKTGKRLGEDLDKEYFRRHGLSTLLTRKRPYGIVGLLKELGREADLRRSARGRWAKPEIRRALDEVLAGTGKKERLEILHEDLRQHGFVGLYQRFGSMAKLFKAAGISYTGKENPYRASGFRWRSAHGHVFKSKAERDFDDLLANLLKVDASEHEHDARYHPSRDYTADFALKRHPVWFEYAGWFFLGRGKNSVRQREYRKHLAAKMRLARQLGKSVVAILPRSPGEWVIRANRPLEQIFRELGLLGKNCEEENHGDARKR